MGVLLFSVAALLGSCATLVDKLHDSLCSEIGLSCNLASQLIDQQ